MGYKDKKYMAILVITRGTFDLIQSKSYLDTVLVEIWANVQGFAWGVQYNGRFNGPGNMVVAYLFHRVAMKASTYVGNAVASTREGLYLIFIRNSVNCQ